MNDAVDTLEGVRTSDEDKGVSDVNDDVNDETLVGVAASLIEDADDDNGGTGVSGGNGEGGSNDVEGVGVSGIVLRRSAEENVDPLGLRNDVSNEVSGPSGIASDLTEGDGSSCDDSYESSVSCAQVCGLGGGRGENDGVKGVRSPMVDTDVLVGLETEVN